MAFSKLTRIILYVVAGISLLVVLFFYVSPKTVDYDELEITRRGGYESGGSDDPGHIACR